MAKDTRLVVVLPDFHVPYHERRAFNSVLKFMAEHKISEVIHLGDFMDNADISHHNIGKLRQIQAGSLYTNYEEGKDVLLSICQAARAKNPNCKFTLIEGNHDAWLNDHYLDVHPELEGIVSTPKLLELKKFKINWIPEGHMGGSYRVGKMLFTHGDSLAINHTRTNAIKWGCNMGYGHTHDVQMSALQQYGRHKVLMAQSHGCMCEEEMPYIRQRPKNWQLAFGIYLFRPDGTFNHYVPIITDGKFSLPNGKTYKG